jgi:hypothetical protein
MTLCVSLAALLAAAGASGCGEAGPGGQGSPIETGGSGGGCEGEAPHCYDPTCQDDTADYATCQDGTWVCPEGELLDSVPFRCDDGSKAYCDLAQKRCYSPEVECGAPPPPSAPCVASCDATENSQGYRCFDGQWQCPEGTIDLADCN